MSTEVRKELLNKLIYVEWVDSHSARGWALESECRAEEDEPMRCQSAGWLIFVGKEIIRIAGHVAGVGTDDFQHHSPMSIPKVAITKVVRLKDMKLVKK